MSLIQHQKLDPPIGIPTSTEKQENTDNERTLSPTTIIDTPTPVIHNINTTDKLLSNRSVRLAIAYVFIEKLDIPPPQTWTGCNGTIAIISRTLNIPKGSYDVIFNVLQNVTTCYRNGNEYKGDKDIEIDNVRETRKIKTGSIEEELIANWMEDGIGFQLTTMLLNEHLKDEGQPEVGTKSVYNVFN